MMQRFVPKWIRVMPMAEALTPAFIVAAICALAGAVMIIYGAATGEMGSVAAGVALTAPFGFFTFILWRTYNDDGYNQ